MILYICAVLYAHYYIVLRIRSMYRIQKKCHFRGFTTKSKIDIMNSKMHGSGTKRPCNYNRNDGFRSPRVLVSCYTIAGHNELPADTPLKRSTRESPRLLFGFIFGRSVGR